MAITAILTDSETGEQTILDLQSKSTILRLLKLSVKTPERYEITLQEDYSELEEKTEAKDLVTLAEWLLEKNVELTKSNFHKLAGLVAKMYKERYQKVPRVIARPDSRGRYLLKASGFEVEELDVLQDALDELKRHAVVESKPAK
ncbi:MAG: hypothetical protein KME49_27435 [Brasilonema octagenarum HA4186-MV1]|jgi:hypothetical protein|nr:hypothetical protein [Brasilonema octagenarum HA4186-MV1]